MNEDRFPICTPDVPPMLGRERIVKRLLDQLTKTSPSHCSVVGARFIGKSVILRDLARRVRRTSGPYCAVIEWDQGHFVPNSDEEFWRRLCQELGQGLMAGGHDDYGTHILELEQDFNSEVSSVIDMMTDEGLRVLMIWDAFDKPLTAGSLTRNLWDNLRELCLKDGLRLVTSTRRPLIELICDEASVTSDFWNIFGDKIQVGAFDESDVERVLEHVPGLRFSAGAKKEMSNWSGNHPPLALALINDISRAVESGPVEASMVNEAASRTIDIKEDLLQSIWNDCPTASRELFADLNVNGERLSAEVTKRDRRPLLENCLARIDRNKIASTCRMMRAFLGAGQADIGAISRLFRTNNAYEQNIRSVLELRLEQIPKFDAFLFRAATAAIDFLPDYPDGCFSQLTTIRDRALNTVLNRELDDKKIPRATIAYWTEHPRDKHSLVKAMMDRDEWAVGQDPVTRLRVVQLLTGSSMGFESKARCTSKGTYVLLNAIHGFRNRGEHGEGESAELGEAVATVLACVELLAGIYRDGQSL